MGDPKQAIYSFRGADVFSYIEAGSNTNYKGATLHQNWRSHPALIQAINTIFSNRDDAFLLPQITFTNAQAGRFSDSDTSSTSPLEILWIEHDKGPISHKELHRQTVDVVVSEISNRLLGWDQTAIRSPQIAVLCRTNAQALDVHQALSKAGVTSALDSDACVFDSEMARQLEWTMQAVLYPSKTKLIRRALSTKLFGTGPTYVAEVNEKEALWTTWTDRFVRWSTTWSSTSFMAFFQQMLSDANLQTQLVANPGGHQQLADLMQLSELLQRIETDQHLNPSQLHRQLSLWRSSPDLRTAFDNDEIQVRPDKEGHAVVITTIHKSKGLEFPEVFVPFVGDPARIGRSQDRAVAFHDANDGYKSKLDLGSPQITLHKEMATKEALSESIRLLYVALTRAQQKCTMIWGPIKNPSKTAFGFLLSTEGSPRESLEKLQSRSNGSIVVRPPKGPATKISDAHEKLERPARQATRNNFESRTITSFSAIVGDIIAKKSVDDLNHLNPPLLESQMPSDTPRETTFGDFPRRHCGGPRVSFHSRAIDHAPDFRLRIVKK